MTADIKPRLEFGQLTDCPRCRRRKVEPGAHSCPDCLAIGRLVAYYGAQLEVMYQKWSRGAPRNVDPHLADDADYQSFESREELMRAYDRWLG
jgi:hypothetical protein